MREMLRVSFYDWLIGRGASEWHRWFAWRSVYLDGRLVRWRWVERRLNECQEDYWWEYRCFPEVRVTA